MSPVVVPLPRFMIRSHLYASNLTCLTVFRNLLYTNLPNASRGIFFSNEANSDLLSGTGVFLTCFLNSGLVIDPVPLLSASPNIRSASAICFSSSGASSFLFTVASNSLDSAEDARFGDFPRFEGCHEIDNDEA